MTTSANRPESSDIIECRHLLIFGRVQGVFYRASLQQVAEQLGLYGWCRNLTSGEVEALIQGSPQALNELTRWCANGPPNAKVTRVVQSTYPINDALPYPFAVYPTAKDALKPCANTEGLRP